MKYSIITFGCRVNQADSLGCEEDLLAAGAEPASAEQADLVVVNTCSVTSSADQAARQAIRRVARRNPGARIVVTGCYATRRPDELRDLPHVVHVIPNDDKPRLVALMGAHARDTAAIVLGPMTSAESTAMVTTAERFGDGPGSCGAPIEPGVAGRTAFTLRVQTGCAEPCSYCIIPSTRGAPRSVPPDAVVREATRVTAAGFKEIAITGVHLGSYGRDLTPQSSLIDLLSRLDDPRRGSFDRGSRLAEQEPVRFRISSLEPMDCSRAVVDLVASSDRFARHFHLPLQHASARVLTAMRRPYTIDQYSALVDDIRTRMPDASIGSDLIVGFPDESSEDFEQLASYLERSPLTHVHVFPYSDRPGTAASAMGGRVSGGVVRERARRIREIGHRLTTRFRESQVGTIHRGLTLEDGSLVVTGNYLKLRIPAGRARNEWVAVKITGTNEPMVGEIC